MAQPITGLSGLAGINAITEEQPFATPEQRYGDTVDPFHSQVGETARPYSWQSLQMPGASHGPYGPENQLLDDPEYWFLNPFGTPDQDPTIDLNSPNTSRSHASVNNIVDTGSVPSQYESVNLQIEQMDNKRGGTNSAAQMQVDQLGYAQQDRWNEIWELNSGHSDLPPIPGQVSYQANGFGANDAASNAYRKVNAFDYGSKHQHRRYAFSSIPGNYMWLRPQGRPLFKTMAGPARPPIAGNSQFAGQDIGFPFSYDTGAILQTVPNQYEPPPSPYIGDSPINSADAMGTDGFDMW